MSSDQSKLDEMTMGALREEARIFGRAMVC